MPDSSSPKTRISPAQVIGGIPGLIEGEDWVKSGGQFIKESPGDFLAATADLFSLEKTTHVSNPTPEQSVERPKSSGTIENFSQPRLAQETNPQLAINKLQGELKDEHMQTITQQPVEDKRIKINSLNDLQALYMGSVDNAGNVTAYHGANADKKQLELEEQQRDADRAEAFARATKKQAKADNSMRLDEQEGASMVSSGGAAAGRVG